jgi:signal transduction histidine kinase
LTCRESDQGYFVKIIDDGPGIPPDKHARAVEMFQTLQSRDTVEGGGVGLALVKKVVEHYSGKMHLESDGKRVL